MLSILTPAFNEEANLDALYQRLARSMADIGGDWEWLVVDDHSRDGTFAGIQRLAALDPRVKGIRLARNAGSHVAITCGLHHVRGDAAVMMASDLQDPPELLPVLLDAWAQGAQVVWAVRRRRPGERRHAGFAAVYYWIMRHVAGMREMPARGADFFLIDRVVIDAFKRFRERHISVLALITWLGFRQEFVEYDKQPRAGGQSGWTLARKITLVIDSVTGFSEAPIRWCSYVGAVLFGGGALLGLVGVTLLPTVGAGLLLLLAAVIGIGGLQLLAIGVVGEYVWRALEEARRRPAYLIEQVAGGLESPQHAVE
jgi:glycosyltransferase involved in cell wall biosynthesis